jgi:hypothetical protein
MSALAVPLDYIPRSPDLKYCPACKTDKPMDFFYRNRHAADGRQGKCRQCTRDYQSRARYKLAVGDAHPHEGTENARLARLLCPQNGVPPTVLERLRARKRRGRAPSVMSPHPTTGIPVMADGTMTTMWATASYTEMQLAVVDSQMLFFEAYIEVVAERLLPQLSHDAREAFNKAVQAKTQAKLAERGDV